MNGGRVAVVQKIDGGFVDVKFDEDEKAQRYTKSSIRRVLQPPLGNNKRVLTKLGLVGKIEGYNPEARTVKIRVFGQPVEIDKCLICEVLPEDPPPPPESS